MSAVADKLREARALIERGWTQEAYCRNADGVDLEDADYEFESMEPVCWCSIGALYHVDAKGRVVATFQEAIGTDKIIDWNDTPERTKAEVLAAFDKAIELAEAQS